MAVLQVGKPYIAGVPSITPRAEYHYRGGCHELLLCFCHPTEDEIAAVRSGDSEFALLIYGLVIFFLYRFEKAIGWSDAPYSWHLVPADEQQLPPTLETTGMRALVSVVLVDADHNIVRALRTVALSPEFTRTLHAAIAEQAAGPWNPGDFDAQSRSAYQSWPTTEQMLSRAIARTRGGA
jgi:hypothetical protein